MEEEHALNGYLGFIRKTLVDLEWVIRFSRPDVPDAGNIIKVCWADIVLISDVVWDQSAFSWLEADVIEQLEGSAACKQSRRQRSLGDLPLHDGVVGESHSSNIIVIMLSMRKPMRIQPSSQPIHLGSFYNVVLNLQSLFFALLVQPVKHHGSEKSSDTRADDTNLKMVGLSGDEANTSELLGLVKNLTDTFIFMNFLWEKLGMFLLSLDHALGGGLDVVFEAFLGDVSCPHVLEGTGVEVMLFSWERHDEDRLTVTDNGLFPLTKTDLFSGDLCSIYA